LKHNKRLIYQYYVLVDLLVTENLDSMLLKMYRLILQGVHFLELHDVLILLTSLQIIQGVSQLLKQSDWAQIQDFK